MSVTPIITELFPADYTTSTALLTALHDHFNGPSTKFAIDFIAAGGVTDGFVIKPTGVAVQYIFRRLNGTQFYCTMEPNDTITAVGDTVTEPTGQSTAYSKTTTNVEPLFTIGAIMAAGSKIYISEWDEGFFISCLDPTITKWSRCIHMGKIMNPDFPAIDEPMGRDGSAILIGAPLFYNSYSSDKGLYMFNQNSPNASYSIMRVSTNIWQCPVSPMTAISNGDATTDNATYMGYLRPMVVPVTVAGGSKPIATFKYIFCRGQTLTPLTRVDLNNVSEFAGLALGNYNSTAAYALFKAWRRTQVP